MKQLHDPIFIRALIPVVILLWAGLAYGAVIHIPADYETLQEGIDAAEQGDTVLIADGTYTGEANRDLNLGGKDLVVMSETGADNCVIDCGGMGRGLIFNTGETAAAQVKGLTITNGMALTQGAGIFIENASPVFINCRITNCEISDSGGALKGGGVYISNADTEFRGCEIINNAVSKYSAYGVNAAGGGVYCSQSTVHFRNCLISMNQVSGVVDCLESNVYPDISVTGGGISVHADSMCYIHDCQISQNTVNAFSEQTLESGVMSFAAGGGVYFHGDQLDIQRSIINNNTISASSSGFSGSGTQVWGGGVCCSYVEFTPVLYQCEVNGNTARCENCSYSDRTADARGGGMFLNTAIPDMILVNVSNNLCRAELSELKHSRLDQRSTLWANVKGGGVYFDHERQEPGTRDPQGVVNCLISGNTANAEFFTGPSTTVTGEIKAGGIFYSGPMSQTTVTDNLAQATTSGTQARELDLAGGGAWGNFTAANSIFWNNTPDQATGSPVITYSDVQDGWPGEGNMDSDPMFVAGPTGEYYLEFSAPSASPCIDAGSIPADSVILDCPVGNITMAMLTTRNDAITDTGTVDLGYHYLTAEGICLNHGDVNFSGNLTPEDALLAFQIFLGIFQDPNPMRHAPRIATGMTP